jgi:dihydrofolate reductase
VKFPPIDPAQWQETAREDREGFSWVTYERT